MFHHWEGWQLLSKAGHFGSLRSLCNFSFCSYLKLITGSPTIFYHNFDRLQEWGMDHALKSAGLLQWHCPLKQARTVCLHQVLHFFYCMKESPVILFQKNAFVNFRSKPWITLKVFKKYLTDIILMLSLLYCLDSKYFPLPNIRNISTDISVHWNNCKNREFSYR